MFATAQRSMLYVADARAVIGAGRCMNCKVLHDGVGWSEAMVKAGLLVVFIAVSQRVDAAQCQCPQFATPKLEFALSDEMFAQIVWLSCTSV